jgi:hypothetical protein
MRYTPVLIVALIAVVLASCASVKPAAPELPVHPVLVSAVAVAPLTDGRLQLWMTTSTGQLFTTWKTTTNPNATWAPWRDFLGEVGPLPQVHPVGAVDDTNVCKDTGYRGHDAQ